jgi:hypothetical protein
MKRLKPRLRKNARLNSTLDSVEKKKLARTIRELKEKERKPLKLLLKEVRVERTPYLMALSAR